MWICTGCRAHNDDVDEDCIECDEARADAPDVQPSQISAAPARASITTIWICTCCGDHNEGDDEECSECGAARADAPEVPESEIIAARAVGGFARFVLGLGWLASVKGLFFAVFCGVGSYQFLSRMPEVWRKEPIAMTTAQARGAPADAWVRVPAVLDRRHSIRFETRLDRRAFTVTPVRGVDGLLVAERGEPLAARGDEPVATYEGEIVERSLSTWRVDSLSLRLDEEFRRKHALVVPADARVLCAGERLGDHRWWFTGAAALLSLGVAWTLARVVRGLRFARDPDAFAISLSTRVRRRRER